MWWSKHQIWNPTDAEADDAKADDAEADDTEADDATMGEDLLHEEEDSEKDVENSSSWDSTKEWPWSDSIPRGTYKERHNGEWEMVKWLLSQMAPVLLGFVILSLVIRTWQWWRETAILREQQQLQQQPLPHLASFPRFRLHFLGVVSFLCLLPFLGFEPLMTHCLYLALAWIIIVTTRRLCLVWMLALPVVVGVTFLPTSGSVFAHWQRHTWYLWAVSFTMTINRCTSFAHDYVLTIEEEEEKEMKRKETGATENGRVKGKKGVLQKWLDDDRH